MNLIIMLMVGVLDLHLGHALAIFLVVMVLVVWLVMVLMVVVAMVLMVGIFMMMVYMVPMVLVLVPMVLILVPMVLVLVLMVMVAMVKFISKAEWLDLVDLPTSLAIWPGSLFFCKIGPLYF